LIWDRSFFHIYNIFSRIYYIIYSIIIVNADYITKNQEANSKGIDGVPYFIVDNEIIPGAASKEMMKNVLLRALKKKESK